MQRLALGLMMLVMTATPAAAQPLWENIDAGMTAAQVQALYPAGPQVRHRPDRTTIRLHPLTGQCRADIHILHPRGQVEQVVLRGEPAIVPQCGTAMLASIEQRLGRAASEATGRPGMLQRPRTTYVWHAGGIHLRFVRYLPEGIGGTGLGNASWELSFSTTGEPPRL